MAQIRMGEISLAEVNDDNLVNLVTEVGEMMKEEVFQAISAKVNRVNKEMPKLINDGKKFDSVGTVVSRYINSQPALKQKELIKNFNRIPEIKPISPTIIRPNLNIKQDIVTRSLTSKSMINPRIQAPPLKPTIPVATPVVTGKELDKHLLYKTDLKKRFAFMENDFIVKRLSKSIFDLIDKSRLDSSDKESKDHSSDNIVLNQGLKLELIEVKCIDETDPEWFGSDKIAMGGVSVDDKKKEKIINEFIVGKFDDGTIKRYNPPRELVSFPLDGNYDENITNSLQGGKLFTVFLGISEKDSGGFSKFLNELYTAVKNELQVILNEVGSKLGALIGSAIGGSVGTAVGGPIGTVIGVVAGLVLGYIIGAIIEAFKDDIFEPRMTTLYLPNPNATFGGSLVSPTNSFNYRDHDGHYRVFYRWRIVR